jgi:hypothetical protein
MKKYSFIPVVTITSALAQYFMPWWTMAIIVAIAAYLYGINKGLAFAMGFGAIFSLWYGMAIFSDLQFDSPMSTLIGNIFGSISRTLVYTMTATVGGLVGGFSSLVGAWARELIRIPPLPGTN